MHIYKVKWMYLYRVFIIIVLWDMLLINHQMNVPKLLILLVFFIFVQKTNFVGFFFYFRSNTILFMNVSWGSYCLQGASLKRTSLGNITSVWWKLKTVLPLESWSNSSWWGFFLLWLSYTCKLNLKKNVGNVVAKFLETEPNMVKQWCKHLT